MAQSLGLDNNENIAMYQNAIEGASSQNSFPIDGLVEASTDSAFPVSRWAIVPATSLARSVN